MARKLPLVAIVDDDLIYQFMLSRIINRDNLAEKILTFPDGEKAIEYLTDNKATNENIPDVIFLDTNMPILDGWQFIEEYASMKAEIKKKVVIFMFSSSIDPSDAESASKISEISNYIIKPASSEEMKVIFDNYEGLLENF
jgi:CheY-like chemotaxis protein